MAIQNPPEGSPFIFAHEFGLIICKEHGAAVFVNSIRTHLRKSHRHDIRDPCKDVDWARDLPNAIRDRHEHSKRQPWKLRRPGSPPLPYLPTHFGGFKCRHPQCGWVYPRTQESRIRKHCLDVHKPLSRPGSLPYATDVCYQTFNSAFADKDGCSYAFEVKPTRAMSRQPKLSPDAAEWELSLDAAERELSEAMDRIGNSEGDFEWEFSFDDAEWEPRLDGSEWELSEAMDCIGDDRPSRRTATKVESSSQEDSAAQSRPVEHNRLRHDSIDSDEPLCFQGRIKLSREHRKCRKRKREETPAKDEESNDSDGSDDSANSDDGESTSDDEASTYGSESVSLGCEETGAGSLCCASMAEPRQHTNDESVERLGRLQQSSAEEYTALRHELQLRLGEIAHLKEQLHRRTGEFDKLLAKKVTMKDKYKKAKKSLSAAEKQHKAKEKEWANHSKDATRNTSHLRNELEKNEKIIRKHELDLAIQREDTANFRKQVQELKESNQGLQSTLDQRVKEARTLQSRSKSREASTVAKSLEEANAALKEAQELNGSYETRISTLEHDYEERGKAILERTSQVFAKVKRINKLEAELKRERARFPEERANEAQLGHERNELRQGYRSTTTESEESGRRRSPMGEEAFATESGRRSVEDLTTQLQVVKSLQVKAEETARKNGEKVEELRNRLKEKEEQLADSEKEVRSLAKMVKRRSTPKQKYRDKRVKRETTALPSPPPSSQREVIDLTEG